MEHLNAEELARLVDEEPRTEEAEHLAGCDACATELETLREQTAALGALPEIMPPMGDWQVLEAHLRSEGLVRDPGLFRRLGLARTPPWMKAAAAAALFLAGAGTGAALTSRSAAVGGPSPAVAQVTDVEDAASAVRIAEQEYVSAVTLYQELLTRDGGGAVGSDPISRFAALEHLVMVSQAAVREAPGDPFLNGFLASAMAERNAALRLVSAKRDNWF
jgi:anti-sigma factor RsiW